MRDPVAPKRVEVAVVTFDSDVTVVQDFVTADRFEAPRLECQGMTHMAAGINTALDMLQARKDRYNQSGIPYYRPWVLMITDGRPQGEIPDKEPEHIEPRLDFDKVAVLSSMHGGC